MPRPTRASYRRAPKGQSIPPWSTEEQKSLNEFQEAISSEPFLCSVDPEHGALRAFTYAMICEVCKFRQKWAHDFMADWSWIRLVSRR